MTDRAKEARRLATKGAKHCPGCGAAIVVRFEGDERLKPLLEQLAELGASVHIETAEDFEGRYRNGAYDSVQFRKADAS